MLDRSYNLNCFHVVNVAGACLIGQLKAGLASFSGVLTGNMQPLDHDKSSYISQLIKRKWRDLQKLLKYFNRITTCVSNKLLLVGVISIRLVLYSKDLLVVVFSLFTLQSSSLFLFTSSFLSSL